jgi:hypothetical protein
LTRRPWRAEPVTAIKTKLEHQAAYVVWRQDVVMPSQQLGMGRGIKRIPDLESALPAADPGVKQVHRWRQRLCDKQDNRTRKEEPMPEDDPRHQLLLELRLFSDRVALETTALLNEFTRLNRVLREWGTTTQLTADVEPTRQLLEGMAVGIVEAIRPLFGADPAREDDPSWLRALLEGLHPPDAPTG